MTNSLSFSERELKMQNQKLKDELATYEKLIHINEHDSLTGLYIKNKFFVEIQNILLKFPYKKYVFIIFDIDHFQLINTFFGIGEGDRLLIYLTDCAKEIFKDNKNAIMGRIGGDIFGVFFPLEADISLQELEETINRKTKEILNNYREDYSLEASVGVYCIEDNLESFEHIHSKVSMAIKYCKELPGVTTVFYDKSMLDLQIKKQNITNDMVRALQNEEFLVFLQPKFHLETNTVVGAEALVRWNHPTKGFISPGEFIPIFEQNGYILKVDYYVWDKACCYAAIFKKMNIKNIPVSINISRIDMKDSNLHKKLLQLVEKYEIEISDIHLEITESAYIDNTKVILNKIKELKKLGFIIEMDDFGTGYSSLNMLSEMPVDVLKLDMGFLQTYNGKKSSASVIGTVMLLANRLNLDVIAEGVETKEQVEFLKSIGCSIGQGYFFSKPIDFDTFLNLLKRNNKKIIQKDKKNITNISMDDIWLPGSELNTMFNHMFWPIAIYEYNGIDATLLRANKEFYSIFGDNSLNYNIDSESYSLLNSVKPVDFERINDLINNASENFSGFCTEIELRKCEEENYTWYSINAKVINQNSNTTTFFIMLQDISERKERDFKQLRFLDRYKFAMQLTETAIWEYDRSTNILKRVNYRTEELEIDANDVYNLVDIGYLHESSLSQLQSLIYYLKYTKDVYKNYTCEIWVKYPNDKNYWCEKITMSHYNDLNAYGTSYAINSEKIIN